MIRSRRDLCECRRLGRLIPVELLPRKILHSQAVTPLTAINPTPHMTDFTRALDSDPCTLSYSVLHPAPYRSLNSLSVETSEQIHQTHTTRPAEIMSASPANF